MARKKGREKQKRFSGEIAGGTSLISPYHKKKICMHQGKRVGAGHRLKKIGRGSIGAGLKVHVIELSEKLC